MNGARLVVALLALLALACGCGQPPPAEYLDPQGAGATGRVGTIVVTDALLTYQGQVEASTVYPPGASVPLRATLINEGEVPDRLISVSSPIAGGGQIVGDPMLPAHDALTTDPAQPGVAADLPPIKSVELRLTALNAAVRAGLSYPVEFTFAQAGTLRLELPVANPDVPRASCPLPPEGTAPRVLTAPTGAPAPPTVPPPACSSLPG